MKRQGKGQTALRACCKRAEIVRLLSPVPMLRWCPRCSDQANICMLDVVGTACHWSVGSPNLKSAYSRCTLARCGFSATPRLQQLSPRLSTSIGLLAEAEEEKKRPVLKISGDSCCAPARRGCPSKAVVDDSHCDTPRRVCLPPSAKNKTQFQAGTFVEEALPVRSPDPECRNAYPCQATRGLIIATPARRSLYIPTHTCTQ